MPSTTTSPPLSPRVSEKKSTHHARRRSGKDAGSAEKKFVRPAVLSRRGTPTRANSGRVTKERERESEDDGESFPQFWYVEFFAYGLVPSTRAQRGLGVWGLAPMKIHLFTGFLVGRAQLEGKSWVGCMRRRKNVEVVGCISRYHN